MRPSLMASAASCSSAGSVACRSLYAGRPVIVARFAPSQSRSQAAVYSWSKLSLPPSLILDRHVHAIPLSLHLCVAARRLASQCGDLGRSGWRYCRCFHGRHRDGGQDDQRRRDRRYAQYPQSRVSARHGRSGRAARRQGRQFLDLARDHVRRGQPHHAGVSQRRGGPVVCRHGQGRLHLGVRVPLPA